MLKDKTFQVHDRWQIRMEYVGYDIDRRRHRFVAWFDAGGLPLASMEVGSEVVSPSTPPDFPGACHAALGFGLAEAEVGRAGRDRDENRPANARELALYEEGFSDAVSPNADGTGHHFEEVTLG